MRDRLGVGLERITFYVALAVAMYVFAGDVIVGALLQRGEFDAADTRLVWYVLAAFSLGLLGTTRSRLLQNGLYALDRPKLVARIAVLRVALAGLIGALLMFPLRPVRHRRIEHRADGRPRPGAAPRLRAAARGRTAAARHRRPGPGRRGVVLGRVPPAPRGAGVADRAIDELGHDTRWSLIAAAGVGVLAAGLRATTDDLPPLLALVVVVGASTAMYLGITATMG